MNSLKIMPKIKGLIKLNLIRDILVTVAICDQHDATRNIGQARRPSAHGNAHYHKLANPKAISRNGGSFGYAISDKSLITYRRSNASKKERLQAPEPKKS